MTARELIQLLESVMPDTPVLVDGYEGGHDHIASARLATMWRVSTNGWYMGDYEEVGSGCSADESRFEALLLSSESSITLPPKTGVIYEAD